MTGPRRFRLQAIAGLLGIAFALLTSACGQSTPSANLPTPSAASSRPAGGPVPSQLLGDWLLPPAAANVYQQSQGDTCPTPLAVSTCMFKLILTATTYNFAINAPGRTTGGGDVGANGTEIDFYNGSACGLTLPEGVGRYTWTLTGGALHFAPLNQDACPRAPLLANQSYNRPT
jgi:hypothetical protein